VADAVDALRDTTRVDLLREPAVVHAPDQQQMRRDVGRQPTERVDQVFDALAWPVGRRAADDEGVWLSQYFGQDGLIHFDGETWSHYLPGEDTLDIAIAPDGTIWYIAAD
jgi:hypothetical protein